MKLDVAYKYCGLMKYKVISDEVESYTSGYTHISTDRGVNCFVSHFEEKTGKKITYDTRLYIDGIPMDEEHIITRKPIDKKIDKIVESGPKRLLKRIFKRKEKYKLNNNQS